MRTSNRKDGETGKGLTFVDEISCAEYSPRQFVSLFEEGQNTKENVVCGSDLARMLNHFH